MAQTFDSRCKLDENAEVRHIGDGPPDDVTDSVRIRILFPLVRKKLLHGTGDTLIVRIHGGDHRLDFFTFFASSPLGFNHPKMLEKKVLDHMMKSTINKPSNSDFYTVDMAEFVESLATNTLPEEMRRLFFISGGALAVENALKTAFDWKVRWNLERGSDVEKGFKVIHFDRCFHGRSGYTLSMLSAVPWIILRQAWYP